jgi:hypothetical protein
VGERVANSLNQWFAASHDACRAECHNGAASW